MKGVYEEMDALFLCPPGSNSSEFSPGLGTSYIVSYLRDKGFSAGLFHTERCLSVFAAGQEVLKRSPRVVGFTVMHTNYVASSVIARYLKTVSKEVIILFGGPLATLMAKEILEDNDAVDVCVRGAAEETCLEILRILMRETLTPKTDMAIFSSVQGITFKKDEKIVSTEDREISAGKAGFQNAIDRYPSPYLTGVLPACKATSVGIITSRGCNRHCTFCSCALTCRRKIVFHSVDRVLSELEWIANLDFFPEAVPVHDCAFSLYPERARKICLGMIENRIRVPLCIVTRADCLDEELIRLMKEAGVMAIGFALESASPRLLREIGKVRPPRYAKDVEMTAEKDFLEKVSHFASFSSRLGIKPVVSSVMIGLPGESLGEAEKTIDLVRNMDVDFYAHNLFKIYPGSPLCSAASENGYRLKSIKYGRISPMFAYDLPFEKMVQPAPNAVDLSLSVGKDLHAARTFSLLSRQISRQTFFREVILLSDRLGEDVLKWAGENMAIHGPIIQVFSSRIAYEKGCESALDILHGSWTSTLNYEAYFMDQDIEEPGCTLLKPGRMIQTDDPRQGVCFRLMKTKQIMKALYEHSKDFTDRIGQENSEEDAYALFEFLLRQKKEPDPFHSLWRWQGLPFLSGLCKWRIKGANCVTFETALVDSSGDVRLCWKSPVVGTIENSHGALVRNFLRVAEQKRNKTACGACPVEKACVKCVFSGPLSQKDYCHMRRELGGQPVSEFLPVLYV